MFKNTKGILGGGGSGNPSLTKYVLWGIVALMIISVGGYFLGYMDIVQDIQYRVTYLLTYVIYVILLGGKMLTGPINEYRKMGDTQQAVNMANLIFWAFLLLGFTWILIAEDPLTNFIILMILFTVLFVFGGLRAHKWVANWLKKTKGETSGNGDEKIIELDPEIREKYENTYPDLYEELKYKGVKFKKTEMSFEDFEGAWNGLTAKYEAADAGDLKDPIEKPGNFWTKAARYGRNFTKETATRVPRSEFEKENERDSCLYLLAQIVLISEYQKEVCKLSAKVWDGKILENMDKLSDEEIGIVGRDFAGDLKGHITVVDEEIQDLGEFSKAFAQTAKTESDIRDRLMNFSDGRKKTANKSAGEARLLNTAAKEACAPLGWDFEEYVRE